MIIRALQLAFIVLAIAVIYPFSAREPVLFPKDTATSDGVVRMQKSDRLPQPKESGDGWTEPFIAAMHRNARERAPHVVRAVGTDGVRRMLDVV